MTLRHPVLPISEHLRAAWVFFFQHEQGMRVSDTGFLFGWIIPYVFLVSYFLFAEAGAAVLRRAWKYEHTCMCVHIYIHVYIHVHICIYIYRYVYIYIYTYIHIYIYIHIYVHIYIYDKKFRMPFFLIWFKIAELQVWHDSPTHIYKFVGVSNFLGCFMIDMYDAKSRVPVFFFQFGSGMPSCGMSDSSETPKFVGKCVRRGPGIHGVSLSYTHIYIHTHICDTHIYLYTHRVRVWERVHVCVRVRVRVRERERERELQRKTESAHTLTHA